MGTRHFGELLQARWDAGHVVCVGLDSELGKIPLFVRLGCDVEEAIVAFNKAIVTDTHDCVSAYKPQAAFYEWHGDAGMRALKRTVEFIHLLAPDVPVILDAKRADIGNTNRGYVVSIFDEMNFDAVTVNPYLGVGALQPFLDREEKGVIILCRTSNPESDEFQMLMVDGVPLYQIVARNVAEKWNKKGNCCLVMGATFPNEAMEVRKIVGDMTFLVPGLGAQQGDVMQTVRSTVNSHEQGAIFNSSRGIIFASNDSDFAAAARQATLDLDAQIKRYL